MPRWMLLLAVAIAAWLAVTVLGGLVLGRLLEAASRLFHRHRRTTLGSL